MTGISIKSAVVAITNAAEPTIAPVIRFSPIANKANAPPIATNPLAISSQDNPPSFFMTGISIARAAAAITNAAEPETVPFIKFKPITNIDNAPPIATNPLAISSQPIFPSDLRTGVNKPRAIDIKII